MTRSEDIIDRLRALKPSFKELGLKRVRVYGSVARGQARPDSDVDLLVEFERKVPDLFTYVGIIHDIQDRLGCKVDMVTEDTLHPLLKDRIIREARDV